MKFAEVETSRTLDRRGVVNSSHTSTYAVALSDQRQTVVDVVLHVHTRVPLLVPSVTRPTNATLVCDLSDVKSVVILSLYLSVFMFLSHVSTLTRDIDIANLSVRPSVCP